MIEYHTGDATIPIPGRACLIAHVVNNEGRWGRGFSGALSHRYPYAETSYRRWSRGEPLSLALPEPFGLGRTLVYDVTDWAAKSSPVAVHVAHLCAQDGIGTDRIRIRYDKLGECLSLLSVKLKAVHFPGVVSMPRIGTGLSGGSWGEVEPLIQAHLRDFDVAVFDLERK